MLNCLNVSIYIIKHLSENFFLLWLIFSLKTSYFMTFYITYFLHHFFFLSFFSFFLLSLPPLFKFILFLLLKKKKNLFIKVFRYPSSSSSIKFLIPKYVNKTVNISQNINSGFVKRVKSLLKSDIRFIIFAIINGDADIVNIVIKFVKLLGTSV